MIALNYGRTPFRTRVSFSLHRCIIGSASPAALTFSQLAVIHSSHAQADLDSCERSAPTKHQRDQREFLRTLLFPSTLLTSLLQVFWLGMTFSLCFLRLFNRLLHLRIFSSRQVGPCVGDIRISQPPALEMSSTNGYFKHHTHSRVIPGDQLESHVRKSWNWRRTYLIPNNYTQ